MKVLPELFEKNRRWARACVETDPEYFERLCAIQRPDLLWIGCSDSRVPANAIVGLAPGELFVHRNVANIVSVPDINAMAVIEFAVNALGVSHIIVCGHYRCGGVRAGMEGKETGALGAWLAPIERVARENAGTLESLQDFESRWHRLCELNVEGQVRNVAGSAVVREAWARGKQLSVHGWIYDLHDGLLRDLDVTVTAETTG
jgi:carbonic anhydrase